ncbi:Hypothetical predicted protein [Pelobates cultripes]|uniref:Uncharacterized protein n=1 Tax=Pelobates cultripes TaxID=61616 RepID=A0AAD1S084_PELCU|nr:Hypothetical predicted protein [Pelobates cultripes]
MEDFLTKAGAYLEQVEVTQITDEQAAAILWPQTDADLPASSDAKDIIRELQKLKQKEIDLELHAIYLSDYYRIKKIPRAFRIKNVPTIGRNNPEVCRKWIGVLNKCSFDLMMVVIEEMGRELKITKYKISDYELKNTALITTPNCDALINKLSEDLKQYKKGLICFKHQKLDKGNADYTDHRVYKCLVGEST